MTTLNEKENSIVLMHGTFNREIFDQLEKRNLQKVFILEGRPSLESSALLSEELLSRKIQPVLISDNMAGFLFFKNLLKEVWLAYQVADQEGAVCDIGGLILGVLGARHQIPINLFPSNCKSKLFGNENDLMTFQNQRVTPQGIRAYVPLVEWIPAKYITKVF